MNTAAYSGFSLSIKDADQIWDFYEKERQEALPRVPEEIEVLKRSALILAVTAWETFLEDKVHEKFYPRLNQAMVPKDISRVFNTVANRWLDQEKSKLHRTLETWTGSGWKEHLRTHFDKAITALNTPDSQNCAHLFKTYLDIDLTNHWKWRGYNHETASKRLDEVISTRGLVTHVARKASLSPKKHILSRKDLESYLLFIKELAHATDKIFAPALDLRSE